MIERIFNKLEALGDRLPDDISQQDCDKNILCECSRRSCPSFTGSIRTYVRKLKAL